MGPLNRLRSIIKTNSIIYKFNILTLKQTIGSIINVGVSKNSVLTSIFIIDPKDATGILMDICGIFSQSYKGK